MAVTTRSVSDIIYKEDGSLWTNAAVTFELLSQPAIPGDGGTIDATSITATSDASTAAYSVDLAVPSSGAYLWRVVKPNGRVYHVRVEDGEATTLAALLATQSTTLSADALQSVLDGYGASIEALENGTTAAAILAKLLTVDGPGSGLDADTVGGSGASAFDAAGSASSAQTAAITAAAALVDDLSGVSDAGTARSNLELGTMATEAAADYAALTGATFTGDVSTTGDLAIGTAAATNRIDFANGNYINEAPNGTIQIGAAATLTFEKAGGGNLYKRIQLGDSGTITIRDASDTVNAQIGGNGNARFNKLGIGVDAAGYAIDAYAREVLLGATTTGDDADATIKNTYLLSRHYTNAEQEVLAYLITSTAAATTVQYGGGSAAYNAATRLGFFTASNNTTLAGSERLRLWENGGITSGATHSASPGAAAWLHTGDFTVAGAVDLGDGAVIVDDVTGVLIISAPAVPASAGASGTAGSIAWDSDYIYVCTAANTWKRAALATW